MDYAEFQERLGYHFRDESLLTLALTHSSYTNEHKMNHAQCNERIEFLGDAVLELASSDFLYRQSGQKDEGEMTKTRASLVCEPALAEVARQLRLGELILMGKGEDAAGGRTRDSILSDALESVIGAIYLDGGFTNAKEFVFRHIMRDFENRRLFYDSKTILQETVQGNGMGEIHYELVSAEGPDHDRTFVSAVFVGGRQMGQGSGHSKKLSEQQAAYRALLKINKKDN